MTPFEKQMQQWGVPKSHWDNIRNTLNRSPGPRTMGDNMRGAAALSGLTGEMRTKVVELLKKREEGVGNAEDLQTVVNRWADRTRRG